MPPARRGIHQRAPGSSHGVTLIEMLVALSVLVIGVVALTRLQSQLYLATDNARHRAEAARLAQAHIEHLRGFTTLQPAVSSGAAARPALAYAAIASQPPAPTEAGSPEVAFSLGSTVSEYAAPRHKSVAVTVRWSDRRGMATPLTLSSIIAGADPALAGAAALRRAPANALAPLERHSGVPIAARRLDAGRSVLKPAPDATVAWVFDDSTGAITSVCAVAAGTAQRAITARELSGCTARSGWSVSGFVRFATSPNQPDAHDAEQPHDPALDLNLCLSRNDATTCTAAPLGECFDDAPATPSSARDTVVFHCAVFPAAGDISWSGRLNIVPLGWSFTDDSAAADGTALVGGSAAPRFTVCRYSADRNGNGRIDAPEHPARYEAVTAPLFDQNFLIIRSGASCPVDRAVTLGQAGADNPVDDSTVQHQP